MPVFSNVNRPMCAKASHVKDAESFDIDQSVAKKIQIVVLLPTKH